MIHAHAHWDDRDARLDDLLGRMGDFRPDLRGIIPDVEAAVKRLNAEYRLAGLGADGQALSPILPQTYLRRRRAGKGNGPPMVPDYRDSRAVRSLVVDARPAPAGLVIHTYVSGAGFLVYHLEPWYGRPARNVLGLPGEAWAQVDRIVLDEAARQFTASQPGPGFFGRMRDFFGGFFGRGRDGR